MISYCRVYFLHTHTHTHTHHTHTTHTTHTTYTHNTHTHAHTHTYVQVALFDNAQQQDAHEFLNYLLNTIGDLLLGMCNKFCIVLLSRPLPSPLQSLGSSLPSPIFGLFPPLPNLWALSLYEQQRTGENRQPLGFMTFFKASSPTKLNVVAVKR